MVRVHVMPLFPQSAAEKMRSSAGLHADQAGTNGTDKGKSLVEHCFAP